METVPIDLEVESDLGLVLLLGAAGASPSDEAIARQARQALHSRYYGYLVEVLERYAENVGTVVIDPEEFALRTFKKAFEEAHTFRDQSEGDPVRASRQIKAWLGRIASNLARDELRRINRQSEHVKFVALDEAHNVAESSCDNSCPTPTNSKALVALEEALAELKSEERDILMTYAQFGIVTESGRELPTNDRLALEERTGYERSTIRQKWRRLVLKLRTQLEPTTTNTTHPSSCQTKNQSPQPTN